MALTKFEKSIRIAAIISIIALAGTVVSLLAEHPFAFIEFGVIGVLGVLIAIFYYLLAVIRSWRKDMPEKPIPQKGEL